MTENKRYKVIVSDRAKRILGTYIRFMAQGKKERDYDRYAFPLPDATAFSIF